MGNVSVIAKSSSSLASFIKKSKQRGKSRILKYLCNCITPKAFLQIGDLQLRLDLTSNIDRQLFLENGMKHESGVLDVFLTLIDRDDVVYDVGANRGFYSYVAANIVKTVVAIEPNPILVELLKGNLPGNIKVLNIGLGDVEGELVFHSDSKRHDLGNFRGSLKENGEKVKVKAISTVIQETGLIPSVIKMDAEGFEWKILHGYPEITKHRPAILLEYIGAFGRQMGFSMVHLFEFFKNSNYTMYLINRKNGTLMKDVYDEISGDYLCLPNDDVRITRFLIKNMTLYELYGN